MRRLQCSQTTDIYHLPGAGCSIWGIYSLGYLNKGPRVSESGTSFGLYGSNPE
jgi:hypothetical protein